MGLLLDLVTLPLLGAPRMVQWLARTIGEEAEREFLDEGRIRGELLELQERYDAGEMGEEDYDLGERALLERLSLLRELKEKRDGGDSF